MALEDNSFNGRVTELVIPKLEGIAEQLVLDMATIYGAETRIIEARTVNPSTYGDLEYVFNDAYRTLKRHVATVGFQILKAEKAQRQAKSRIILEVIPEMLSGKPKNTDNADFRQAVMMRDEEYVNVSDRLDQLKTVLDFLEGRIKVMENVQRYMRKQMDLIIRSGSYNIYNTQR
jgi:hypothetical protein